MQFIGQWVFYSNVQGYQVLLCDDVVGIVMSIHNQILDRHITF